jgi:hypothetical protein
MTTQRMEKGKGKKKTKKNRENNFNNQKKLQT